VALLAFAAERRAAAPLLLWALAAIDRYLLPAGLTAANPPHAPAVAQDGTDRRTDGRTDTVSSHRHCCILCEQCQ